MKIPIYLVDIDGTVADLSHRLWMIKTDPPDWDGFFAACSEDAPIVPVIHTVRTLGLAGADIVFISGRSDATQNATTDWLLTHGLTMIDGLYMRKAGDHRPDNIVKSELLDQFLKDRGITESDITAAFEDRDQVVKMYRDRGVRVFQVADGNF